MNGLDQIEQVFVPGKIEKLAKSKNPEDRKHAAQLLGMYKDNLHTSLHIELIRDFERF